MKHGMRVLLQPGQNLRRGMRGQVVQHDMDLLVDVQLHGFVKVYSSCYRLWIFGGGLVPVAGPRALIRRG